MKKVDAAVRNRLFLQAIEEMHAMEAVWSVKDDHIYDTFRPVWERMTVRLLREAEVSAEVMQEFERLSPRGKEDCVSELGWCGLDRLVRWFVADALFVRVPRMLEEAKARENGGGASPVDGCRGH